MGIFSKIWEFFVSPVVLKKEKPEELLVPVRFKSSRVKLNKTIIVPENWWLVFAVKDKPCDILQPGHYKANENDLPITTRTSGAMKKTKKGNVFPWIKCSAYYIRQNAVVGHRFRAGMPFIVKTETFGRIKGKIEGVCNVRVTNPELFLKCLFVEYFRMNRKSGLNFVRDLVVDEINALLEHEEDHFEKMLLDAEYRKEIVNHIITARLQKIGVLVEDITIESMILSKKTQKIVSAYLAENQMRSAQVEKVVAADGTIVNTLNEQAVDDLIEEAKESKTASATEVNPTTSLEGSSRPQLYDQTQQNDWWVQAQPIETKDNGVPENIVRRSSISEEQLSNPATFDALPNRDRKIVDFTVSNTEENGNPRSQDNDMDTLLTQNRRGDRLQNFSVDTTPSLEQSQWQSLDRGRRQSFDFTQGNERDSLDRLRRDRSQNFDFTLHGRANQNDTTQSKTKDIFAGTTDKKQCKYCDKLIGIEYQYCPFCGFKQDK